MRKRKVIAKGRFPDFLFLASTIGATIIGLVMVYNASLAHAQAEFGDPYHFLTKQVSWAIVGIFFLLLASYIPYPFWRKISVPIFVCALFLLLLVFIPGIGTKVKGAYRWIDLGVITVQPSDFVKFGMILYLSSFLSKRKQGSSFLPFLGIVGLVSLLVLLEPDFGTTIVIIMIALSMYFISGAPVSQFLLLAPGVVLFGIFFIFSSSYRLARLKTYVSTLLDPNRATDPLGASYHIRQVLIALGSGGLMGVGLGRSRQKYEYIPEVTTDSIFAIIGEEIGFIGAMLLIMLFLFIILRALHIAQNAPDDFSKLCAYGITFWIASQILLNLAAMVALVPLTGVTLPFISYGGSSLISILTGCGILLQISRYQKRERS